MSRKILRKIHCPIGKDCPAIERREEGGFDVIGERVEDSSLLAHEAKVHVPDTLLPELASLDIPDFGAYLEATRKTPGDVLRVQTLVQYGVPSDDEDFQGYLDGAPEPVSPYREPWFKELRDDTAAGRAWRNVHVVRTPLSPYLRYAFEWGYAYTVQAGQDVRILDVAEHPAADALFAVGDFWVVGGTEIVLCRYDGEGRPAGTVGVGASSTASYVALGDLAWRLATPFRQWWAEHPLYHRAGKAA